MLYQISKIVDEGEVVLGEVSADTEVNALLKAAVVFHDNIRKVNGFVLDKLTATPVEEEGGKE